MMPLTLARFPGGNDNQLRDVFGRTGKDRRRPRRRGRHYQARGFSLVSAAATLAASDLNRYATKDTPDRPVSLRRSFCSTIRTCTGEASREFAASPRPSLWPRLSHPCLTPTGDGPRVSRRRPNCRAGKPASLVTTFQGNANAFQSALAGEAILVLAALVVIYIILGVLYESIIHPITILSTLPSAGIGALLLLMAVRVDLSVIAMIGIILLIGIVKKNGIMLVDFALEVERNEGLSPEQSIYQACVLRFRPILMTTMAALLGGVPLMLGAGAGSEIRQPLGYTIVGGLLLSQILTLFTTPVVYLYLDRLAGLLRRGERTAESPGAGATTI